MHTLLQDENVLAVVGNVGTPTAVVASPIATRNRTLFFGAFSGAGVLRKMPPERYVINFRASYAEETATMVEALITYGGVAANEIAFFTQRDAFGDAGFSGGMAALQRRGISDEKLIAHGRYERNTTAVENGLADILMAKPEPKAVIMVGAYSPCAAFIRLARKSGLKALFLNISFVGAAPLAQELGADGEGVIITQVVPHYDAEVPIVAKFRKGLKEYLPQEKPSFGALEGYIVGNILIRSLTAIGGQLTRESIVDALEGVGEFDIGLGNLLNLNKTEHQASHQVWPTIIRNGDVVPLNWSELVWRK
jgi:ABC-type branched-subunit amino acid transport system substrate-binding protein